MSIQRPDDSYEPDLQQRFGLDAFANKVGMLQQQQPGLDNGPPWKSGNLPLLQDVGRHTGPGQTNTVQGLIARAGEIDPRLTQNRGF